MAANNKELAGFYDFALTRWGIMFYLYWVEIEENVKTIRLKKKHCSLKHHA